MMIDYTPSQELRGARVVLQPLTQAFASDAYLTWLNDPEPIRLHAAVTIAGDELEIDVTKSDCQRASGMNNPEASTHSMIHYAVKCIVAPDLSQNQGCDRPISIRTRKGSILDPIRPAAVSIRHLTEQALGDVVLRALAPIGGDHAAAACQTSFPAFVFGGFDDRPQVARDDGNRPYYVISDMVGGGMGGGPRADGLNAVDTHGGNCAILSAEVMETLSPLRVLRTELVPRSGGTGEHRGGLGILRDYEILCDGGILNGYCQQSRDDTAPWGYAGGGPGGKAMLVKNPGKADQEDLKTKIIGAQFRKGDILRVVGAGGGGWGDPSKRHATLAEHDRREGYV